MIDINEWQKLDEEYKNDSYYKRNKKTTSILHILSFLGNIGSIILAFNYVNPLLVEKLIYQFDNMTFVNTTSLVFTSLILVGIEMIKRLMSKNVFKTFFNKKSNKREVKFISSVVLNVGLLILSFFLSVKGGLNLADTTDKQVQVLTVKTDSLIANLDSQYNVKIDRINRMIASLEEDKSSIRKQQNEQQASNWYSLKFQDNINEINDKIEERQSQITSLYEELEVKKMELRSNIEEEESLYAEDNLSGIQFFIILTLILECLPIVGISIKEKFLREVHQEAIPIYEEKINKQIINIELLKAYYNNGRFKKGDKTFSKKMFGDYVKKHINEPITSEDIDYFRNLCKERGIIKISGSKTELIKTFDEALNLIKEF